MNKTDGKFFAYVAGLKGPVPVIYHDGISERELKTVLVKWPLNATITPDFTIKEAMAVYPFPVQQMEKPASQTENSGAP
jgi:hypothetical protein